MERALGRGEGTPCVWHSICTVQRDEAMLSGQAGEAGSIGAQRLLWPLLGVISAQPGPVVPSIMVLDRQEELGSG